MNVLVVLITNIRFSFCNWKLINIFPAILLSYLGALSFLHATNLLRASAFKRRDE